MKRGSSGLSLVVGVDKPSGLSSHDVVSRVRRIFGEKRVGHAGTLDPFASGVLLTLVGPAARLDKYLVNHDKEYIADIAFGYSTDTDDLTGATLHICQDRQAFKRLLDVDFAKDALSKIVGHSMQLPPVYSAIKRAGKKACDEARRGNVIELDPRPVTIYKAELIEIMEQADLVIWRVKLAVSKGTYIRSIARDLGHSVDVPAHLVGLRRTCSGGLSVDLCSSLQQLEENPESHLIDPIKILGMRVIFANDEVANKVLNGGAIAFNASEQELFEVTPLGSFDDCGCIPSIRQSSEPLKDKELVAVVANNLLKAIYSYDADLGLLKADCIFNIGVSRG